MVFPVAEQSRKKKIWLKPRINDIVDRCSLNCISWFLFFLLPWTTSSSYSFHPLPFHYHLTVSRIPLCLSFVTLFIEQHFAIQASLDITWNQFIWYAIVWLLYMHNCHLLKRFILSVAFGTSFSFWLIRCDVLLNGVIPDLSIFHQSILRFVWRVLDKIFYFYFLIFLKV